MENNLTLKQNTTEKDQLKQTFGRKDIENTPFTIIFNEEDKKIFACVGDARITEIKEYTKLSKAQRELEAEVKEITWDRIMQVVYIIMQKQEEFNNYLKQIK